MLITETVRVRAKRTKFWDHQGTEKFYFWSCDLEKSADSAFLGQKGLISERVRVRAKRTQFWYPQRKKMYLTEKLHFWTCDLEKVPILCYRRKKVLSWKTESARAKWMTFQKQRISRKIFIFGRVTLKKGRFFFFTHKNVLSQKQ